MKEPIDSFDAQLASEMIKRTDKLGVSTVDMAIQLKQAREFMAWSASHLRTVWTDWLDETDKVNQKMTLFFRLHYQNLMQQPFKTLKLPEQKHQPSLPADKFTPKPERNNVASPVRLPVNKQAALLLSPFRCWLSQPIPDKPPTVDFVALKQIKAALKIERNDHARTRDSLGNCRGEIRQLRHAIEAMGEKIERLNALCKEKDDTIRQLEDLKL